MRAVWDDDDSLACIAAHELLALKRLAVEDHDRILMNDVALALNDASELLARFLSGRCKLGWSISFDPASQEHRVVARVKTGSRIIVSESKLTLALARACHDVSLPPKDGRSAGTVRLVRRYDDQAVIIERTPVVVHNPSMCPMDMDEPVMRVVQASAVGEAEVGSLVRLKAT